MFLRSEINRKDQEIMSLIEHKTELMRRYGTLLDQCTVLEYP